MVGVSGDDPLLVDLDIFDLLGIRPVQEMGTTTATLLAAARRVMAVLHPDKSSQRPTGRPIPYTFAQASAVRDWLYAGGSQVRQGARFGLLFRTGNTNYRSRWNPQAAGMWTNPELILRPVPGSQPGPSSRGAAPVNYEPATVIDDDSDDAPSQTRRTRPTPSGQTAPPPPGRTAPPPAGPTGPAPTARATRVPTPPWADRDDGDRSSWNTGPRRTGPRASGPSTPSTTGPTYEARPTYDADPFGSAGVRYESWYAGPGATGSGTTGPARPSASSAPRAGGARPGPTGPSPNTRPATGPHPTTSEPIDIDNDDDLRAWARSNPMGPMGGSTGPQPTTPTGRSSTFYAGAGTGRRERVDLFGRLSVSPTRNRPQPARPEPGHRSAPSTQQQPAPARPHPHALVNLALAAGDPSRHRIVVATVVVPSQARRAIVTLGADERGRVRYQVVGRDLAGVAIPGTGRANSTSFAGMNQPIFLGRFRRATEIQLREFALAAFNRGTSANDLPLREASP